MGNTDVSAIHDCFVVHSQDVQQLLDTYKEVMIEIANSNLLSDIMSEILGYQVTFPKYSTDLPKLMEEAQYMLS